MKKLFMSLVAVVALSASAETVTLTPQSLNSNTGVVTTGNANFNIVVAKNNGATPPAYNDGGKDLRVYAKGSLTLEAAQGIEITEVVFNISTQGLKRLAPITASVGTIATQALGDNTVTWTGNSNAITYTVGDYSNYGSDGDKKAGQLDFTDMKVTYTVISTDPDAVFAPVITYDINSDLVTIECATEGASIYYTLDNTTPDANSTLYTAPFELSASCTVTAVAIKGEGISNIATLNVNVPKKAKTIAEMLALATNEGDVVMINCDLTVVYVNGKNVYVIDDVNGSTLFYANNTYKVGDVIPAGWNATYKPFGTLPEFVPTSSFPAVKETVEVKYPTIDSVTEALLNKVAYLNNVTFEESTLADHTGNATFVGILADGSEITFYNNFIVPSVEAGSYKVLLAVSSNKGNLQVYPIEYSEVEVADEEPTPLYVVGANVNDNAWSVDAEAARMTYLGNGIYEWKGETLASDFKFSNGSWVVSYGAGEGDLILGEEYGVVENSGNIAIADFVGYILTDPVVIFDYNNLVIKVSGTKTATELTWYVAGDFNDWKLEDGSQMTKKEDGSYELEEIIILEGKENGCFKVCTTGWGNQYGDVEVTNDNLSVELKAISGEGGNAPYTLKAGTYSVTWVPATATVIFEVIQLSGVEGIDADEVEAVYYNLQGVKVANPTNGIYVKVVGKKAQKVTIAE